MRDVVCAASMRMTRTFMGAQDVYGKTYEVIVPSGWEKTCRNIIHIRWEKPDAVSLMRGGAQTSYSPEHHHHGRNREVRTGGTGRNQYARQGATETWPTNTLQIIEMHT
jgi:hypothetical protein